MAVDRADLSINNLSLDRMVPVSSASAVQGQSSGENDRGKARRDPPPRNEASADSSEEEGDSPLHRIDRLA